jgi:hypothetical protein
VELRRALLLFAIVLGLAAIATTVSRPQEEQPAETPTVTRARPQAGPGPGAPPPARLSMSVAERPATATLESGRPGTLVVATDEPGTVELPTLGLLAFAERLTPARFELYVREAGRHDVRFTPAGDSESRQVGTLRIKAEQPGRPVR